MSGNLGKLINIGVRAPDMERELEFLKLFTTSPSRKTGAIKNGVDSERAHISVGSADLTLFRAIKYDPQLAALGSNLANGCISHLAFEVDDTEAVIKNLARAGFHPLLPTYRLEESLVGPASITFFRSPNGVIIETKEQHRKPG